MKKSKIEDHKKQSPSSDTSDKAFNKEKLSRELTVKLAFVRALGHRPNLRDLTQALEDVVML